MIAKAISISHGLTNLRYISGESKNKKNPELITRIADNLMPIGLDASGIWELMRDRAQMKKNVIKIEISPAKQYTELFDVQDWQDLWNEFIKEYDAIEFRNKYGEIYSHKTNLAESMFTVWLHEEAASGIPHLHVVVCRKDENGRTNNDHNIMARAQLAAERVSRKRGWKTAAEVHESRTDIAQVSADCMAVLRSMQWWNWGEYMARLTQKGYSVKPRRDKNGVLRGYTISKDGHVYKASELGKGRNLMASKIEATWKKLQTETVMGSNKQQQCDATKPGTRSSQEHNQSSTKSNIDYSVWHAGMIKYDLTNNGRTLSYYLPKPVLVLFDNEFDYREVSNCRELTDMAVSMFVGLTALDTASYGSGGGGSGNDNGWRDRKDEDELERARRCARHAISKIGKTPKSRKRQHVRTIHHLSAYRMNMVVKNAILHRHYHPSSRSDM